MRIPTILAATCLMLAGCNKEGCTAPEAANYNRRAVQDDGSCEYPPEIDGYTYELVTIGEQVWFAENLRTTVYRNGDLITSSLSDDSWGSNDEGATTVYGQGDSNCWHQSPDIDACDEVQALSAYGRLYNCFAIADPRGLCPVGWHVPTDGEWTVLEEYISSAGFSSNEGVPLRSSSGWLNNYGSTDDFGFSALPGGARDSNGDFIHAGSRGYWWSSSSNGCDATNRYLSSTNPSILQYNYSPWYASSVRCIQD